jgi:nucleotide-binding universal stress UspA family protein
MKDATIVVPLDGSLASETALSYARALAAPEGSRIILLSVLEPEHTNDLLLHLEQDSDLARAIHARAQQYLDGIEQRLAADNLTVTSAIVSGVPSLEIARFAEDRKASLMVMATHGRGGVQRWALGSVADKVMRTSRLPTLLVRPPETQAEAQTVTLRRLLVPLDGSPLAETALEPATALAQAARAKLVLLRVEAWVSTQLGFATEEMYVPNLPELEEAAEAGAREYLASVVQRLSGGVDCEPVVIRGFPNIMLEDYARANAIDLVIMCTHGRSGLARFVVGSKADALVRAGIPTLLIRPQLEPGHVEPAMASAGAVH